MATCQNNTLGLRSLLLMLLLEAGLLCLSSASRNGQKSFFAGYAPPHVLPPALDYIRLAKDSTPNHVHSPFASPDYSSFIDSNSKFVDHEDYADATVHPPSPDDGPVVVDNIYTPSRIHPDRPAPAFDTLARTNLGSEPFPTAPIYFRFPSVNLHISFSAQYPIPQILTTCSCSNGTVLSNFFINAEHGYEIDGAGDTTWSCQFKWSTITKFFVQEFIVYNPPATSNDWGIDSEGFNLLESNGYVHIHDWVQSPEGSPQMDVMNGIGS